MNTTRTHLLESLTIAEINHGIAKDKSDTAWGRYLNTCDLVKEGYASEAVLETAWDNWMFENKLRIKKYDVVDALKAQLIELDEIAAALDKAKAEMREYRYAHGDNTLFRMAMHNRYAGEYHRLTAEACDFASDVIARQIAAHL